MNSFENLVLANPILRATDVKRYSGMDSARSEDILQHTCQVMTLSYLISLKLIGYGDNIDVGSMLEKGLLHDVDESLTGDIPRPIKYYDNGIYSGIKSLGNESARRLVNQFSLMDNESSRVIKGINECKKGSDGLLVSISDLLLVAYKSYEEVVLLGNKKFLKVAVESQYYLAELHENVVANWYDLSDQSVLFLSSLVLDAITTLKSITDKYQDVIHQLELSNYNFSKSCMTNHE